MNKIQPKEELLFIVGELNIGAAQEVRYSGLIPALKKKFNITLISFRFKFQDEKDIVQHSIVGSSKILTYIAKIYNKLFKYAFFPDVYSVYINLYKRKIKKLMKRKRFDSILIGVTPFSLLALTEKIRNLDSNIPIYIDFSDPFSKNSLLNENEKKKALILEKQFLIHINKIFVVSHKMKEYYDQNLFNNHTEKTVVIEQGIKNELLSQIENNNKNSKTDFNNLKLIYAGGFYDKLREPFELYKAIESFSKPLKLDVYGGIKNHFLPPKSDRFNYKGLVPSKVVWEQYMNVDIIVFIDNFQGIHVPGKTVECLSLKKPILFIYENEDSPTLDFMKHSNGVYYSKNNHQEIIYALNKIISDFEKVNISFDYSRYTWERLGEKMVHELTNF